MTAVVTIRHADLVSAVERLRIGVGASDLHGSLVGYLCAGGEPGAAWLGALQLEAQPASDDDAAMMARLLVLSRASLGAAGPAFEPLLPEADNTLEKRIHALVEWCRGFLGGLGLAGAADPADMSTVAADIVRDFGTVASTRFAPDNADDDANALADLHEFVCDGVLLLHAEMRTPTARGRTLQ